MPSRLEFLDGIEVNKNDIDMIDAFAEKEPGFTVEAYWDEFCSIMASLRKSIEHKRDNTLILTSRCVPCDYIFENPIPTHISPNPFEGICCPQCGDDNPNALHTKNYRVWEKEQHLRGIAENVYSIHADEINEMEDNFQQVTELIRDYICDLKGSDIGITADEITKTLTYIAEIRKEQRT